LNRGTPYSAITSEDLREQAFRAREHARRLAGDPAADRLQQFARELDARADAMDEHPVARFYPSAVAGVDQAVRINKTGYLSSSSPPLPC
jgi:hypothetical protein